MRRLAPALVLAIGLAAGVPPTVVAAPEPVAAEPAGIAPPPLRGLPGRIDGLAPSAEYGALTAKLQAPTPVYRDAGLSQRVATLSTRTTYTGSGTRLLVTGGRYTPKGRLRLRVVVPLRPTGRPAWISADSVRLIPTRWFIDLDRPTRKVRIFERGQQVQTFDAVIGAPSTPTPGGLAAIFEKVPAANPRIFTGPWSLHLTAFSRVLDEFGAGDGRVAMHGRGPASWGDPLGSAASHGCIRIDNYWSRWLARHVPLGTPVSIR